MGRWTLHNRHPNYKVLTVSHWIRLFILTQDGECQDGTQEPWNAPVHTAGRKGRGRSAALKMLKSNDENQPPVNQNAVPNSAPANLLSEDMGNSQEDASKNLSQSAGSRRYGSRNSVGSRNSLNNNDSPTEAQELLSRTTSATSSGGSRTVLCVQPLTDLSSKLSYLWLSHLELLYALPEHCIFGKISYSITSLNLSMHQIQ